MKNGWITKQIKGLYNSDDSNRDDNDDNDNSQLTQYIIVRSEKLNINSIKKEIRLR